MRWPKEFKYGLLRFIANDLNEVKLNWADLGQYKCGISWDHRLREPSIINWVTAQAQCAVFTGSAAKKAIKIIPIEFFKNF